MAPFALTPSGPPAAVALLSHGPRFHDGDRERRRKESRGPRPGAGQPRSPSQAERARGARSCQGLGAQRPPSLVPTRRPLTRTATCRRHAHHDDRNRRRRGGLRPARDSHGLGELGSFAACRTLSTGGLDGQDVVGDQRTTAQANTSTADLRICGSAPTRAIGRDLSSRRFDCEIPPTPPTRSATPMSWAVPGNSAWPPRRSPRGGRDDRGVEPVCPAPAVRASDIGALTAPDRASRPVLRGQRRDRCEDVHRCRRGPRPAYWRSP